MIALQEYKKLGAELRHLVTVVAFWGEPMDEFTLAKYLKETSGLVNVAEFVRKSLPQFLKNQWIARVSKNNMRLVFKGELSRAAYLEMVREGNEKNWWPSVAVAGESGDRDLFPELHRTSRTAEAPKTSFAMLVSEGVRLVATGTGVGASPEFRATLSGGRGRELVRAIACVTTSRFAEEPVFVLSEGDPLLKVLPAWFCHSFLLNAPVTNAIAELHRVMAHFAEARPRDDGAAVQRTQPEWDDALLETYWAMCAWTGRKDWFEDAGFRPAYEVYCGIDQLFAGNLRRADGDFKAWHSEPPDEDGEDLDFDTLHVRTLMAAVAAFVNPDKLAKTRPAQLFVGAYRYLPGDICWSARSYASHMGAIGDWAERTWADAASGKTGVLEYLRTRGAVGPVTALVGAVSYRQLKTGRGAWRDVATLIWEFAKEADRSGWMTLAGLLAALLAGGYDAKEEEAYLKDLDARSLAILPRVEPEPEWKGLLSELEKAVAKTQRAMARKSVDRTPLRQLVWYVAVEKIPDTDVYTIDHVKGAIHLTQDEGDLSDDQRLESYEYDKKAVRSLMTEKDQLIKLARYPESSYGYYRDSGVTDELVDRLCGAPNLIECKHKSNGWDADWAKKGYPMTLKEEKCEMTSSVNEDGGLVLSVPAWTQSVTQDWCVRKERDGDYRLVRIDAEAKKVISIFRSFGSGGRVVIPKEGMKRAEPLVEALATMMPLAEPSADDKDVRRVPAAHDVRLRLDFTEGVLTVRAVVLPVADNPNLTLDPGFGPVEKLIVGAVASFVLVRDLAAESLALAPVRAALADSESAFDGKSVWRFDNLAEGLGALVRLKALSLPLEWPDARRLSVVNVPASGVKLTSQRTADDWFRVEGQFELDDGRVLSVVELLEAAKSRHGRYVRLSDGDYVALTDSMSREIDALNAAGRRKGEGLEIVKAAIPMLDGVFGSGAEDGIELPDVMEVTAQEIRAAFAKKPATPRTLNAELRSYQVDGYRWLSRLAACGFGACLADDMGLGKTIQVITLLLERAAGGASLVIAPSSVCGNWRRELERFAPTLDPVMALEDGVDIAKAGPRSVVIASYGYLLFHEEEFAKVAWNGLVLDEAQAIKNDASKRAKAVKRLHAKFRVAATGTPVENRLGELWSLFDFLNPGLLGPAASFAPRFTADGKAVPQLKRLVKPLILRRLKGDVLEDLPEKTEVTIPVELGKTEREAYEGCRVHALRQLASQGAETGGANRMSILAELTRLRRFCCHPSLVLPGEGLPSAKMEALVELLEGLHESHHRALVFSQFTDYLAIVRKVLDAHGWRHLYLDGTTPTLEREKLVNAFQGGEGEFFVISLKAGGTGLNLTAANYVILLDPWWNPAVENQAADRAHRIGQKNPVTVYRLIASDTVEARVIELHQEKQAIAEDVLEGTSSTALTPAQLMKLFT